jgi:hypothetical protein
MTYFVQVQDGLVHGYSESSQIPDQSWVEILEPLSRVYLAPGVPAYWAETVDGGLVIHEREAFDLSVDGNTIDGFPNGSTLTISGPASAVIENAEAPAELVFPAPGTYRVSVRAQAPRYLPATVTISA